MTNDQDDDPIPIVRDLRPFPETSEARARGCRCRLARHPVGTPVLEKKWADNLFADENCTIPIEGIELEWHAGPEFRGKGSSEGHRVTHRHGSKAEPIPRTIGGYPLASALDRFVRRREVGASRPLIYIWQISGAICCGR
jgi:hypothetical protein